MPLNKTLLRLPTLVDQSDLQCQGPEGEGAGARDRRALRKLALHLLIPLCYLGFLAAVLAVVLWQGRVRKKVLRARKDLFEPF